MGIPVTVTCAGEVLPASSFSIVPEDLYCLPPADTVTVTLRLVEVDSPEFSTDTANVGLPPPLRWFSVGSAASSVDPTLTPFSALPWVPPVVACSGCPGR